MTDNKLEFSQLTSSEDVEFTLRVYLHAQRVMYDNTQVYLYEIKDNTRGHPTSVQANLKFIRNDLSIAAIINKASNLPFVDVKTRMSLLKRSSSATISVLMSLWQQRGYISRVAVSQMLDYARELGVYPIKGRTFTWKSTLLAHLFLNCKSLFLSRFN